jgi:hypothetical protein
VPVLVYGIKLLSFLVSLNCRNIIWWRFHTVRDAIHPDALSSLYTPITIYNNLMHFVICWRHNRLCFVRPFRTHHFWLYCTGLHVIWLWVCSCVVWLNVHSLTDRMLIVYLILHFKWRKPPGYRYLFNACPIAEN